MLSLQTDLTKRGATNLVVTGRRLSPIWGGTSLLSLFLRVISDSLTDTGNGPTSWSDWEYVVNLSEADMPLQSMEALELFLFEWGLECIIYYLMFSFLLFLRFFLNSN
jgi:hypothetical protein